jgi:hypothetical protein
MYQETASKADDGTHLKIFILAVVTPKHRTEVERVFSDTRWQTHVVPSLQEARQALGLLPISVVLCEDTLSDGKWLDLLR